MLHVSVAFGALNIPISIDATLDDDATVGGYEIDYKSVTKKSSGTLLVGTDGGKIYHNSVFVFKLPDLEGHDFVSASINWNATSTTTQTTQLYGMRISNSNAVTSSDFTSTNSEVTLMSGMTSNPIPTETGHNNTILNTWLSGNYAAGKYLVISFGGPSNDYSDHWKVSYNPTLNVIPEFSFSSLALCGSALVVAFFYNNFRRKRNYNTP